MAGASVEELYRGRFLVLFREGRWEYVQRTSNRGAVFVLAVTPQDELVLVEQYRVPLHGRTIELPAGILGDEADHADETPETCAMRELEEETGFRGSSATVVAVGPVAPGMTSELLYLVRVERLEQVGPGGGVGSEDIRVHRVPVGKIDGWLAARRAEGLHIEPRIHAGLYHLKA